MARDDIEASFPGLRSVVWSVTSPSDADYNCVAWAASETGRWWDPASETGYFWPPETPRLLSLPSMVTALATVGFEPCEDAELESDFEKVTIYTTAQGWPTHVARQLASGAWTSKLGVSEDIEHASLAALEGTLYARVARILRKRRLPKPE